MYRVHKKTQTSASKTVIPKNCFAENTKSWLWVIMIIVVAAVICAIVTSSGQQPAYSAARQSLPQVGQFRNVALKLCPYCPGFLDAQGRCNVPECPVYSPNWGRMTSRQGIPVRQVLIKELAMEVGASEGRSSVIIHSVYVGGNAEKAGLQAGDRIYRFNGRKVRSIKQFKTIVARAKPESDVKIQVRRGQKKIKSVVMIGEGEMEGVTLPRTRG